MDMQTPLTEPVLPTEVHVSPPPFIQVRGTHREIGRQIVDAQLDRLRDRREPCRATPRDAHQQQERRVARHVLLRTPSRPGVPFR